jgi:hypothetical protein
LHFPNFFAKSKKNGYHLNFNQLIFTPAKRMLNPPQKWLFRLKNADSASKVRNPPQKSGIRLKNGYSASKMANPQKKSGIRK